MERDTAPLREAEWRRIAEAAMKEELRDWREVRGSLAADRSQFVAAWFYGEKLKRPLDLSIREVRAVAAWFAETEVDPDDSLSDGAAWLVVEIPEGMRSCFCGGEGVGDTTWVSECPGGRAEVVEEALGRCAPERCPAWETEHRNPVPTTCPDGKDTRFDVARLDPRVAAGSVVEVDGRQWLVAMSMRADDDLGWAFSVDEYDDSLPKSQVPEGIDAWWKERSSRKRPPRRSAGPTLSGLVSGCGAWPCDSSGVVKTHRIGDGCYGSVYSIAAPVGDVVSAINAGPWGRGVSSAVAVGSRRTVPFGVCGRLEASPGRWVAKVCHIKSGDLEDVCTEFENMMLVEEAVASEARPHVVDALSGVTFPSPHALALAERSTPCTSGCWSVTFMDLLEGQSVRARMDSEGPSPCRRECETYGRAMMAMGAMGFVHRDMYDSNVMVCRDGSIGIVDLALVARIPKALAEEMSDQLERGRCFPERGTRRRLCEFVKGSGAGIEPFKTFDAMVRHAGYSGGASPPFPDTKSIPATAIEDTHAAAIAAAIPNGPTGNASGDSAGPSGDSSLGLSPTPRGECSISRDSP